MKKNDPSHKGWLHKSDSAVIGKKEHDWRYLDILRFKSHYFLIVAAFCVDFKL